MENILTPNKSSYNDALFPSRSLFLPRLLLILFTNTLFPIRHRQILNSANPKSIFEMTDYEKYNQIVLNMSDASNEHHFSHHRHFSCWKYYTVGGEIGVEMRCKCEQCLHRIASWIARPFDLIIG